MFPTRPPSHVSLHLNTHPEALPNAHTHSCHNSQQKSDQNQICGRFFPPTSRNLIPPNIGASPTSAFYESVKTFGTLLFDSSAHILFLPVSEPDPRKSDSFPKREKKAMGDPEAFLVWVGLGQTGHYKQILLPLSPWCPILQWAHHKS